MRITESLDKLDRSIFWRLPTQDEWLEAAEQCLVSYETDWVWPWKGGKDPIRKEHAHLNFSKDGGAIVNDTLEVGLFPKGESSNGFFDLIGNVYEIVLPKTDNPSKCWKQFVEKVNNNAAAMSRT